MRIHTSSISLQRKTSRNVAFLVGSEPIGIRSDLVSDGDRDAYCSTDRHDTLGACRFTAVVGLPRLGLRRCALVRGDVNETDI